MSLRQDFKKHSIKYQIELESVKKIPSRQDFLKAHVKQLENEIKIYKQRISLLSQKRAELKEKERELQNKIVNNQWRIEDFNESIKSREIIR